MISTVSFSRKLRLVVSLVGLAVMTPITVIALADHGLMGLFSTIVQSSSSLQIFLDLFVALNLALVWIWFDSRSSERRFWPWLLVTYAIGSFGPLLYLLVGSWKNPPDSGA